MPVNEIDAAIKGGNTIAVAALITVTGNITSPPSTYAATKMKGAPRRCWTASRRCAISAGRSNSASGVKRQRSASPIRIASPIAGTVNLRSCMAFRGRRPE